MLCLWQMDLVNTFLTMTINNDYRNQNVLPWRTDGPVMQLPSPPSAKLCQCLKLISGNTPHPQHMQPQFFSLRNRHVHFRQFDRHLPPDTSAAHKALQIATADDTLMKTKLTNRSNLQHLHGWNNFEEDTGLPADQLWVLICAAGSSTTLNWFQKMMMPNDSNKQFFMF